MEFPSLADPERERLTARGIDPERSYWAWRQAIHRGEISPLLLEDLRRSRLPHRALEAASYLAEGFTEVETAERMNISRQTVKHYTKHLRAATGKRTTAAAVLVLARHGVI